MQRVSIESASEAMTRAVGRELGRLLRPGDCVSASGDLGAGKTRLVQGIASGLGIDPNDVSSPTFVLCHVHEGRMRLLHVDAYRLTHAAEFEELGVLEQIAGEEAILVIEWGEKIAEALPDDRIEIVLSEIGPDARRIEIKIPERRAALCNELKSRLIPSAF